MPDRLRMLALVVACCLFAGCNATSLSATPFIADSNDVSTASPPNGSGDASPAPSASEAAASPSATPTPKPTPKPAAAVPPKPTHTTFELVDETSAGNGTFKDVYRLTWSQPKGKVTQFLVYGVKDCLRESAQYDGKPCVVKGMSIPKKELVLLKKVPGDRRTTTVSWKIGEIGLPPYSAILIRAKNKAGNSTFTIVHSENVCWQCTY